MLSMVLINYNTSTTINSSLNVVGNIIGSGTALTNLIYSKYFDTFRNVLKISLFKTKGILQRYNHDDAFIHPSIRVQISSMELPK